MNNSEINNIIDQISGLLEKLKSCIDPNTEFESLRKLLDSDEWPHAAKEFLICSKDSVEEQSDRGRAVVEIMSIMKPISGNFLDYGCGAGYCSKYVASQKITTKTIGFDIKSQKEWNDAQGVVFTDNWDEVVKNGPYDSILMFDVLDHLIGENQVDVLKKIGNVLTQNGNILMRVHPWMSRHANHHYYTCNKAYIHLVFTPEEFEKILPSSEFSEPSMKSGTPIMTYDKIVKDAGLKFVGQGRQSRLPVDQFFKRPEIVSRILKNTGHKDFPEFQMSLQFIDYLIVKS